MTDGDLETYGTAYFSAAERPGVEFKFKSSTLIKTVDIYGDYGELQYLRAWVDSWYCGRCGTASVCYIECHEHVFRKKLLLRKSKDNSYTDTYLRIYEIRINGESVSQKINYEEKKPDDDDDKTNSGGISAGKIGGIVAGTLCGIILLVGLIKVRRKRRREKSDRFYHKVTEEYVRGSEGGALSGPGQFLIPRAIVYSKNITEFSMHVQPRGALAGQTKLVKFRIDRTGERQTGTVTVRFNVDDRDTERLRTPTLGAGDIGTTVEEPTGEFEEEIEPTVEEQLLPPSAPEEPPPLYHNSNIDNLHNEVPSYEEVMANSEYFPGVEL